jgi:uncharacterized membrane protein YvbJ
VISAICIIIIIWLAADYFPGKEDVESVSSAVTEEDKQKIIEEIAKENALKKGVLDKADENAKTIIQNFVSGMIDTSDYTIVWK